MSVYIGYGLLVTFILWISFVFLAQLLHKFKDGKLAPFPLFFAKVFGVAFVAFDICYNVTIGTIIFLQMPNPDRLTLTSRLKQILRNPPSRAFFFSKIGTYIPHYRYYLALFFCKYLIEPSDPGHCGLIND